MDIISFLMGREDGERHVVLSGDIICTDDGDGNVEVTNDGD